MNHKATIVSLTNLSHSAPPLPSFPEAFSFSPSFLRLQFHFKKRKLEQSEGLLALFSVIVSFFAVPMFYCLYFLYFKTKCDLKRQIGRAHV